MTPSLITIRNATKADAELIADISRRTFYDTFAKFNTAENMNMFMDEQFTTKNLIEEVGKHENIFLLAYLDKECVGYVKLSERKQPVELENVDALEIARIYTEQKTIGKGVGKALMLKCIDIARKKNKKVIWLGVWEHNETALSFYKKFGFEVFGKQLFILGEDVQTDFLMKKDL